MAALSPDDFAKKASSDPKFLVDLALSADVEKELIARGYVLPANYVSYVLSAVEKIKIYITDQGHVLEVKAQAITSPMFIGQSMSGNGAAGTGW